VERHRLYADQDPHRIFCFAADPDPYPILKLDQVNNAKLFDEYRREQQKGFVHAKHLIGFLKKICMK
jgi:hypothetical protein